MSKEDRNEEELRDRLEEEEELASLESELAELDSELENFLKSEEEEISLDDKPHAPQMDSQEPGTIETAIKKMIRNSLKPQEKRLKIIEEKVEEIIEKKANSSIMKLIDLVRAQNVKIKELEARLTKLEK
ncbi:MAG: hypothetical protein ACFFDT_07525 [Candidatus Hodarchaeota archaeon]